MKILQICAYAAPYEGNFINTLKKLDELLTIDNHEVIYAFPENARQLIWIKELSIIRRIYFLPINMARIKPSTYFKLKTILTNEKIDIVHSHFELYDIPVALMSNKKIKVFWHLHDPIEEYYQKATFSRKALFKFQYKYLGSGTTLLSVSEKHKDFAIKLGYHKNQAYWLPNAIDIKRFKPVSQNHKEFDFLIFGWEFIRKGVDLLLQAGEILYKKGYTFKVGIVAKNDFFEVNNIIQLKDSPWLVLQEFVEDVGELYNKTSTFLHISRAEGLSYALLEATYSGLNIICSDIPENVLPQDFPTIKYIQSENVVELVEMMRFFLINPDLSRSKSEISRKIIENEYSLEYWCNKVMDFYNA